MHNMRINSILLTIGLAALSLGAVSCSDLDESEPGIKSSSVVIEPTVAIPSPTPGLVERGDCIVDPGLEMLYETDFKGPQPGRILFKANPSHRFGSRDERGDDVWAVDEDGNNLTNLSNLNGTNLTGLKRWDKLAVSRDGLRLAFVVEEVDYELRAHISVMDTYGEGLNQITFPKEGTWTQIYSNPVWFADGSHLAYSSFISHEFNRPITPPSDFSNTYIVKADGSVQKQLIDILPQDLIDTIINVSLSPDNEKIAFSVLPSSNASPYIGMQNRETETIEWTLDGVSPVDIKWSPNGKMIAFVAGGSVYVVQANGSCYLNMTALIADKFGDFPFEIETPLLRTLGAQFVWTNDSQSLLLSNSIGSKAFMAGVDGKSVKEIKITGLLNSETFGSPLNLNLFPEPNPLSQDNKWILTSQSIGDGERIVLVEVASGEIRELGHEPGAFDHYPSWSPDRSKIVFVRDRGLKSQLMVMNSDGSGLMPVSPELGHFLSVPIWIRQSIGQE